MWFQKWPPPPCDKLSIPVSTGEPDLVLDQQMQMQASNALLDHPLVTLVNQGSLGGLPPLCFVHGNGELLRDEQIYAAHKAANPERYPPSEALLKKYPVQRKSRCMHSSVAQPD